MSFLRRALAGVLAAAAPVAMLAAPATAAPNSPGAVYVLSNQVTGNQVIKYARHADGTLTPAGTFATSGTGTGGGLGSQGAVILDHGAHYLYAVNAGSSSISSLRVRSNGLELVETISSGGTMPTSLTVRDDVLYVLNAGGTGNITGFTVDHGDLTPLAGSTRSLSGPATAPAEVSFDSKGNSLVVTERATNSLDVFTLDHHGVATTVATVPSSGPTPFGFAFDRHDHAIVSEAFGGAANASAVSSYELNGGALTLVSASVPTTETAACWIAISANGKFAYAGNAGTNSVTGYRISKNGALTILDADGKTGVAPAGVTDLAISHGHYLYGRLGNGMVGAWSIADDGSLTALAPVGGLPAGAAGIAAT